MAAGYAEAVNCLHDAAKDLAAYNAQQAVLRQLQEQQIMGRVKDLLERASKTFMTTAPDASRGPLAYRLTDSDWHAAATCLEPLSLPFVLPDPATTPTVKARHAASCAASAVSALASVKGNPRAKGLITTAIDVGLVDRFVAFLRQAHRENVSDRCMRACLYKMIETLMYLSWEANTQQQQALVGKEVVDVCIELLTSQQVEAESRLLCSKTIYSFLVAPGRVVNALRQSKVMSLNLMLQTLAGQVPDPVAAATSTLMAGGGSSTAPKAITMPVLLPAIMSWIWLLPDYIVDHLELNLVTLLGRIIVLVWPEGWPGIPLRAAAGGGGSGGGANGEVVDVGPLQVSAYSLPNRSLRTSLNHLFGVLTNAAHDGRLVDVLRGACLPEPMQGLDPMDPLGQDPTAPVTEAQLLQYGMGLPYRLVKVLQDGRPDGVEVKVALELLDDLFAADEMGPRDLGDDALEAGLLRGMGDLKVFECMQSEAGVGALSAYVRLTSKLIRRSGSYSPALAARLPDSGVLASVAYMAFWPGGKLTLKLEALQALLMFVELGPKVTEVVVQLLNFYSALCNTLLGGDPETKKANRAKSGPREPRGKGKKSGLQQAEAAEAGRGLKEQIQATAFDILVEVLKAAELEQQEDDQPNEVWRSFVESGFFPRLLQSLPFFTLNPALLVRLLQFTAEVFAAHKEVDTLSVGEMQAACAPHVLPLLQHDDPAVATAAAELMLAVLEDSVQYSRDSRHVEEGGAIVKALVAAGPTIDTADDVAAKAAAAQAAAAAAAVKAEAEQAGADGAEGVKAEDTKDGVKAAAGGAGTAADKKRGGSGGGAEAAAEIEIPDLVDVTAVGLGLLCSAVVSGVSALLPGWQAGRTGASGSHLATPVKAEGPRGSHGAESGAGEGACASGMAAANNQPSTPGAPGASGAGPGPGSAVNGAAAAELRVALELGNPACLAALLTCCAILAEGVLSMPQHGHTRKHMARAFAYARCPIADLLPALERKAQQLQAQAPQLAPGMAATKLLQATQQQVQQLVTACQRASVALKSIPVLDVSLLPKPKDEEEDAKDTPAASAGPARKRANSTKRAQAAAGDGPAQPKRQRTTQAAAALAAAEGGDGAVHATMTRTRSVVAAANGDLGGSPRNALRGQAAAAGRPPVSNPAALAGFVPTSGMGVAAGYPMDTGHLPGRMPSLPHPILAPMPTLGNASSLSHPLESPSTSGGLAGSFSGMAPAGVKPGLSGGPGSATAGQAAAVGSGAGTSRPSIAADFKAKFLEVKARNSKLEADIAKEKELRHRSDERVLEFQQKLVDRDRTIAHLQQRLDEQQAVRGPSAAELQQVLDVRNAEIVRLHAENQRLQAELEQLNELLVD